MADCLPAHRDAPSPENSVESEQDVRCAENSEKPACSSAIDTRMGESSPVDKNDADLTTKGPSAKKRKQKHSKPVRPNAFVSLPVTTEAVSFL